MAEPVRKHPIQEETKAVHETPDKEYSGIDVVQRWVEGPDGRMELLELPLTPELFLDPQEARGERERRQLLEAELERLRAELGRRARPKTESRRRDSTASRA